jgi:hypothetical protein
MNPSEAEEHLRVIRRLMERATIYRAISAPTALVGGLLSLLVGAYLHWNPPFGVRIGEAVGQKIFFAAWGGVLLVTGLANALFLAREARRRGGSFLSPGMRKAFRAIFPAFLAAAVMTVCFVEVYHILPMIWMILYGLALISASQISPEAIPRLGWGFLIMGLVFFGWAFLMKDGNLFTVPNLLMAISFGGLHLLYAALTWSTRDREEGSHV